MYSVVVRLAFTTEMGGERYLSDNMMPQIIIYESFN